MSKVSDYFGSLVFDDKVMRATLPGSIYQSLEKTITEGAELNINVANAVAQAMKEWAIANGATHYTHWFQPLTGITAEKHDGFISRAKDGSVIMEFSGKELIKGEPDASSFPSGGLRATFEARGYTAWDPTSYAFIKGNTLCIPTAFCSYSGEALDKKTPLLRSMEALTKQGVRVLKVLGMTDVKRVSAMVGAEQEYFLVPKSLYDKRLDLRLTGRTLFGAMPPKGQEMDDHYFGAIRDEVSDFMKELNEELWKLGIIAKTEHNEVAPSQHELACLYTTVNVATDQNQLVMEMMHKVAEKHDLVCLLHEKPFAGVNGSGKHNNWSISTDTGVNLLAPGETPRENMLFLVFLSAVIKAVDEYQDLLRISVATAANDHRLGANEAPPAIVSMFLGDALEKVVESIDQGIPYEEVGTALVKFGTEVLPRFKKDNTDRNRTSSFAFTGNKFEFRMLGSSSSIAGANVVINSAVADALKSFADVLEAADDVERAANDLVKDTIKAHKRIIFNGNGYDDSWVVEAEKRGLLNYRTTADCVPHFTDEKNKYMFMRHGIFTEAEIESREEIMLENYCKTILIEAKTMETMASSQFLPAISKYTEILADRITKKSAVSKEITSKFELDTLKKLAALEDDIYVDISTLTDTLSKLDSEDYAETAKAIAGILLPVMATLREDCDKAEKLMDKKLWPIPTYSDLLFWRK